jgi:hypothetical protein
MVLGALTILIDLKEADLLLITGLMIVFSAIAYRSAKRRSLGEVDSTIFRQFVEALLMLIVLANFVLRNSIIGAIVADPVPTLIIPMVCIVAYLIVAAPTWISGKSKAR